MLGTDLPRKSFATVSITDAGVDTLEFLEAAQGLVRLFGILSTFPTFYPFYLPSKRRSTWVYGFLGGTD